MTIQDLIECFQSAIECDSRYIAVAVSVGWKNSEIIVNPRDNFKEKLAYYMHAYDESLRHKFAGDLDICITGFTHGDSFKELEGQLSRVLNEEVV